MFTKDPKQVLLSVLDGVSAEEITRDEIIRRLEGFDIRGPDAIRLLKRADPTSYVKRNPIVYSTRRLRESYEPKHLPADAPPAANEDQVAAPVKIDATVDPNLQAFIPTASYRHLKRRMNPQFPINVYVYGETGVGKSSAALQIAKEQRRPAVRVNLSKFADVDELFGGLRISDGTTHFEKGPVLLAMETGAVLILDECDSADPTLLTDLHPVLERRGYLVKRLRQMVYPAPGFCVIATANTRGRGDLTGKHVGTNVLNVAFLDRFATSIHYQSPTPVELRRILLSTCIHARDEILDGVVAWYEQIQKAVESNAIDETISPRKIIDIVNLMMADDVQDANSQTARECIIEGTNLMDMHISQALAELWDIVVAPLKTQPKSA